jgi:threonine/homoserine/homoserine lactone efflux protein
VPGPSVLFIVGRALAAGRRAALATVLGNACGTYTVAVLVALGFGPLLQHVPALLTIIKVGGGLLLILLGILAIRSRPRPPGPAAPVDRPPAHGGPTLDRTALRQGYAVGLTNPKAFLVFAVIMPPFLRADVRPLAAQMALLALVPVFIGLACDAAWATASSVARDWFGNSGKRLRVLRITGGTLMALLGLLMIAE